MFAFYDNLSAILLIVGTVLFLVAALININVPSSPSPNYAGLLVPLGLAAVALGLLFAFEP